MRYGTNAAVAIAFALLLGGCGTQPPDAAADVSRSSVSANGPTTSDWVELPAAPLTPRREAHAFWVDDEFLVMGGRDTPGCSANSDCALPSSPALRDAASYSPAARRWTRRSEAPVPLGEAAAAVLDGVVYMWISAAESRAASFLAYHMADDRWRQLPLPASTIGDTQLRLTATNDEIIGYHPTHDADERARSDHIYDPASGEWRPLPVDSLAPSYDRSMVWTGDQLVLLALDATDNPGSRQPSLYRAVVLDTSMDRWRQLRNSKIAGGAPQWVAVNGLVVNPTPGGADGGEINGWDRWYPYGGVLNVEANAWEKLPPRPRDGTQWIHPLVANNGKVFSDGQILDMATKTWTTAVPPPDGIDLQQAVAMSDKRMFVWGGVTHPGQDPSSVTGWTASLKRVP